MTALTVASQLNSSRRTTIINKRKSGRFAMNRVQFLAVACAGTFAFAAAADAQIDRTIGTSSGSLDRTSTFSLGELGSLTPQRTSATGSLRSAADQGGFNTFGNAAFGTGGLGGVGGRQLSRPVPLCPPSSAASPSAPTPANPSIASATPRATHPPSSPAHCAPRSTASRC